MFVDGAKAQKEKGIEFLINSGDNKVRDTELG